MSDYGDDPEVIRRRIWRGIIVQEYGPDGVDALDYIRAAKQ